MCIRDRIKCVLFLVPFFVLAGIYFYDDPFKVLREYKKYDNDPIFLNEDYIGWKTYKNYRDSLHFDSFILGNSCTMAFLTSDWEKHLNGSKAIRLYGTAERLAAIHRKVMALDKEEEHITNVLLIVDATLLREYQLSTGSVSYTHLDVYKRQPFLLSSGIFLISFLEIPGNYLTRS